MVKGASRQELVDAVSAVSQRATYQPWHKHTSNAVWLLTRYGGTWGALRAVEAADELDEIDGLSLALAVWPVLGPALPSGRSIDFKPRVEHRNALLIVEIGGVLRQDSGPLHLRDGDPTQTFCGVTIQSGGGWLPVQQPRRTGASWCPTCGVELAGPFADEAGWTVVGDA